VAGHRDPRFEHRGELGALVLPADEPGELGGQDVAEEFGVNAMALSRSMGSNA
jgi:hypothetical protein